MPNDNSKHLKRGGITPEAQAKGLAAMKKVHEDDAARAELAKSDPFGAYGEIHAQMTKHIVKLLRDEARGGETPSREVTDRLREYRQLTEALSQYHRDRGEAESAKALFAYLDERLATVNLREDSPTGPPA